jgi:drug/metabolite transporter (DMT)-like permease
MMLIASLCFNLLVFLFFRLAPINDEERPAVIAFNYIAAFFWAFFSMPASASSLTDLGPWLPYALGLGVLFIATFIGISKSVSENGMGITATTGKMSLVIPMLVMAFATSQGMHVLQWLALALALGGIYLQWGREDGEKKLHFPLLLAVFFGSGIIDTLFSWVSHHGMGSEMNAFFNAVIFGLAGVIGLLLVAARRPKIRWGKAVLLGGVLGSINFGSVYYYLHSLNPKLSGFSTATALGMNNMGQVVGAALLGFFFFKEPLHPRQLAGLVCCLLALLLLGYAGGV